MRVLPAGDEFAILADKLAGLGAQVRRVRYLLEDEAIVAAAGAQPDGGLVASSGVCRLSLPYRRSLTEATGSAAAAARDAFDILWQDHQAVARPRPRATPIQERSRRN